MLLVLSVLAFALSACGNKGPLVLPDKPQEQQDKEKKKDAPAGATAPAATPANAANKQ
jgi:predicted small lipoprotein YifL